MIGAGGTILLMATLQREREMYAAMFGDDSVTQVFEFESLNEQLDSVQEALYLYQDLLSNVLMFHPDDQKEIAFLKKHIQECKVQKRELIATLNNALKENTAA